MELVRMMRAPHCKDRSEAERGSVLVEFAIVLPLLLLLTFGIIEFSLLFNADSNVAQSTRAGGRSAAILSTDPQMEFKAAEAAANALNISPSSVTGSPTICVGKYDPASSDPCGDFVAHLTLVHVGTPNSPLWEVQVPGQPQPGTYPATDSWPVANRNFGCAHAGVPGSFDKVVVRVSIAHNLIDPGMFKVFFGGHSAPTLSSSSAFALEPVPSTSC
jgi:Flp pilus assembly protein TadG